jgi:tyrosyl-tRNA synthetase
MSKSIPGSGISVTDSDDEIKKTIREAYCPAGEIKDNPILEIAKLIVFPLSKKIAVKRPAKFGGEISFKNYEELEKIYKEGKLHPLDLKQAVINEMIKIITPIRKNY